MERKGKTVRRKYIKLSAAERRRTSKGRASGLPASTLKLFISSKNYISDTHKLDTQKPQT